MSLHSRTSVYLLAAATSVLAQDPQTELKIPAPENCRVVANKVDGLLRRENGTRLIIEGEHPDVMEIFRKQTHRILFYSSKNESHLSCVVVEPIAEETHDTMILTGALLVSLSAVDSIEEGLRVVSKVTAENEKDGRPRAITLNHGIRLLRFKSEYPKPRFEIDL